jgi:hypothetical protein
VVEAAGLASKVPIQLLLSGLVLCDPGAAVRQNEETCFNRCLSSWYSVCAAFSLFFKREMELSLIGLQNAGKSSLVNVLTTGSFHEDMIPTVRLALVHLSVLLYCQSSSSTVTCQLMSTGQQHIPMQHNAQALLQHGQLL